MRIDKIAFRARVGKCNCNIPYFKQKINIHNAKYISTVPVKTSSCFMLIFSSLLFAVYSSVFLINFKIIPEANTNLKLTLNNYILTTSIDNIIYLLLHHLLSKHILFLSGDIGLIPFRFDCTCH